MTFLVAAVWAFAAAAAPPEPPVVEDLASAGDRASQAYAAGDFKTALAIGRPAAEVGDAQAQLTLGLMYERGAGMTQDRLQAFEWFHRSALQANPVAEAHLGALYLFGVGVSPDPVEAYRWLSVAWTGLRGASPIRLKTHEYLDTATARLSEADLKRAKALVAASQKYMSPRYPSVVTKPNWLRQPTAQEIAAYYPRTGFLQKPVRGVMDPKAPWVGVEGRARLRCHARYSPGQLHPDGFMAGAKPEACEILEEAPAGYGFGEAGVRLIEDKSLLTPMTLDGSPVNSGLVLVTVVFEGGQVLRSAPRP